MLISTEEEYNEAFEKDFREKCEMLHYYQGNVERKTLDSEWTESELKDDLWTESNKYLNGEDGKQGWVDKNNGRAMRDYDLCKVEYLVEDIVDRVDLVELYNKEVDKHRNDEHVMFGITYFDEAIRKEIVKTLKNNLITS